MTTIFCGFDRDAIAADALAALEAGTRDHHVSFAEGRGWTNLSPAEEPAMAVADIVFGQPPVTIADARARWVQLTSAGYERYDAPAVRAAFSEAEVALTTSSSVYADPCAEHLLALMLACARCLPAALDNQRDARSWPSAELRRRSTLLRGGTLVVFGYGAIARRLLELLAPFDMDVTIVRRTARDGAIAASDHEAVDQALQRAQHVAIALPGSAAGCVDADRIASLRDDAFVYNVGRGTTVDQDALLARLEAGTLGGAYLDVTDPEPLERAHPLWSRAHITPHTAGGQRQEQLSLVRHFLANLERFGAGEPLLDRVL